MDCSTPGLPCPSLSLGVCSDSCPLSWWCYSATSSSASPFFAFSLSQHRGYVFSLFSGSVGLKHMHLLQFPIIEKAVSFFYQVRKIFPVAGSYSLAFWCVHSTCWILLPSVSYSNAFSPTNLTSDYLCWKNYYLSVFRGGVKANQIAKKVNCWSSFNISRVVIVFLVITVKMINY